MPNTPRLSLPFPASSDPADVPADIEELATSLDQAVVYGQGTFAARPVSTVGSPGIPGRLYRASDTGLIFWDTGTAWVEVTLADGAVTPAKVALGAIVNAGLGPLSVSEAKLAAGAVTSTKLGAGVLRRTGLTFSYVSGSETGSYTSDEFSTTSGTFTTVKSWIVPVPASGIMLLTARAQTKGTSLDQGVPARLRVGSSLGAGSNAHTWNIFNFTELTSRLTGTPDVPASRDQVLSPLPGAIHVAPLINFPILDDIRTVTVNFQMRSTGGTAYAERLILRAVIFDASTSEV